MEKNMDLVNKVQHTKLPKTFMYHDKAYLYVNCRVCHKFSYLSQERFYSNRTHCGCLRDYKLGDAVWNNVFEFDNKVNIKELLKEHHASVTRDFKYDLCKLRRDDVYKFVPTYTAKAT